VFLDRFLVSKMQQYKSWKIMIQHAKITPCQALRSLGRLWRCVNITSMQWVTPLSHLSLFFHSHPFPDPRPKWCEQMAALTSVISGSDASGSQNKPVKIEIKISCLSGPVNHVRSSLDLNKPAVREITPHNHSIRALFKWSINQSQESTLHNGDLTALG
jgi:hypothetical protein